MTPEQEATARSIAADANDGFTDGRVLTRDLLAELDTVRSQLLAMTLERDGLKEENAKIRGELSEVEFRLASQLTAATQLFVAGQEQLAALGDDQHPGAYAVMMADRDGYKREASMLKSERDSLRDANEELNALAKNRMEHLQQHIKWLAARNEENANLRDQVKIAEAALREIADTAPAAYEANVAEKALSDMALRKERG